MKHFDIAITEHECIPTLLEDVDCTPGDIAEAEAWWQDVGRHSNYLRARIVDLPPSFQPGSGCCEGMMHKAVQSPVFRRDDSDARDLALAKLTDLLAITIKTRIQS